MADCSFVDLTCRARGVVTDSVGGVVQGAFERMCHAFADAGAAVLDSVAKSFLATSTIDLSGAGIDQVFATAAGIAAVLSVLLLIVQVARTGLTGRGEHLAHGVVGVFKAGLVTGCVITVTGLLLKVADDLSVQIMNQTVGGGRAFSDRMAHVVVLSGSSAPGTPVALLLIFGLVAAAVGIVLFAEMLFRHALVVLMVAVSPIAAAGMIAGSTAQWWRNLAGAALRLIFLKPLVVLIFGVSFAVAGTSDGVVNVLAGLATLAIAAAAWPLLGKVCTWTAGSVSAAGGAGAFLGGLAGAGAGYAMNRSPVMSVQSGGSIVDSDRATAARNMSAVNGAPAAAGGGAALGALAALRIAGHAKEHLKGGLDQMSGHAGLGSHMSSPPPLRYDLPQQSLAPRVAPAPSPARPTSDGA